MLEYLPPHAICGPVLVPFASLPTSLLSDHVGQFLAAPMPLEIHDPWATFVRTPAWSRVFCLALHMSRFMRLCGGVEWIRLACFLPMLPSVLPLHPTVIFFLFPF